MENLQIKAPRRGDKYGKARSTGRKKKMGGRNRYAKQPPGVCNFVAEQFRDGNPPISHM